MRDWTVLKPGKGFVRMLTPEEIRDLKTRRPPPRYTEKWLGTFSPRFDKLKP